MRVAVVSNDNAPGCVERNLESHLQWLARAAKRQAQLVLFPELSLCGYGAAPYHRDLAMTLRSPQIQALQAAARRHQTAVSFGFAHRRRGKIYLAQALLGPEGVLGTYDKVHLAGREGDVFTAGEAFRVFTVAGVGIGINICYDGRHPASSLALAHLGAEVILHPHGNYAGHLGRDPLEWTRKKRAYLAARCVDTCTYSLICNSVGTVTDVAGAQVTFGGGALVLGPDGEVVARSRWRRREPHLVVADLDLEGLREKRLTAPLRCRRPDVYARAFSN